MAHFSNYHRHDDDLSIHLYVDGEVIFGDGGLGFYQEKDPKRIFVRSPKAHSTTYPVGVDAVRNVGNLISKPSMKLNGQVVSAETSCYGGILRRTVDLGKLSIGYLIIVDEWLELPEADTQEINFFLPNETNVKLCDRDVYISTQKGNEVVLTSDLTASNTYLNQGWDDKYTTGTCVSHEYAQFESAKRVGWSSSIEIARPTRVDVSFCSEHLKLIRQLRQASFSLSGKNELRFSNACGHSRITEAEHSLSDIKILSLEKGLSKLNKDLRPIVAEVTSVLQSFDSGQAKWLCAQNERFEIALSEGQSFEAIFSQVYSETVFTWFSDDKFGFWVIQQRGYDALFLPRQNICISLKSVKKEVLFPLLSELFFNMNHLLEQLGTVTNNADLQAKTLLYHSFKSRASFFSDFLPRAATQLCELGIRIQDIAMATVNKESPDIALDMMPLRNTTFHSLEELNRALLASSSVLLKIATNTKSLFFDHNETFSFVELDQSSTKLELLENCDSTELEALSVWISGHVDNLPVELLRNMVGALSNSFDVKKYQLFVYIELFTSGPNGATKISSAYSALDSNLPEQEQTGAFFKVIDVHALPFHEKLRLAGASDFYIADKVGSSIPASAFAKVGVTLGSDDGLTYAPFAYVFNQDIQEGQGDLSIKAINIVNLATSVYRSFNQEFASQVFGVNERRISCENTLDNALSIRSKSQKHCYLALSEENFNFNLLSDNAFPINGIRTFQFRFSAMSKLAAKLFIIGYTETTKVFSESLYCGESRVINFTEEIDSFQLFLRIPAGDHIRFFDVQWSAAGTSSSVRVIK